ncbi:hypothetical protein PO909_031117 [Leuciscus waleckii]
MVLFLFFNFNSESWIYIRHPSFCCTSKDSTVVVSIAKISNKNVHQNGNSSVHEEEKT